MRLIQRQLAHAILHGARDSTRCALKVAESTWQNDFFCYRACISHHASVEKSKDKTERCCKDQYKPKPVPRYHDGQGA